jgi:GTPase SAR1 family protein
MTESKLNSRSYEKKEQSTVHHSSFYKNKESFDTINYFIECTGNFPSFKEIEDEFVVEDLRKALEDEGFEIVVEYILDYGHMYRSLWKCTKNSSTVLIDIDPAMGYLDDEYNFKDHHLEYKDKRGKIWVSDIEVYYLYEDGLPKCLKEENLSNLSVGVKSFIENFIFLICQDDSGNFYTRSLSLKKDKEKYDFDLNLHYGDGFDVFHKKAINRVKESQKGMVLFYGDPGTGKTFYIKRFIRDLDDENKKVLYLPSSLSHMLGSPSFNTFILDFIEEKQDFDDDSKDEKKKEICAIIVIEDAEKALIARENNAFGGEVANLLNSTDGILNDFFRIQIVATFNTDIQNIDSAVLREQRLLAIKKFDKLDKDQSQKLADSLQLDIEVKEPKSVAEIYSIKDNQDDDDILLSDTIVERKRVGFGLGK